MVPRPGAKPVRTISGDFSVFDLLLQNEVCNGPGACLFRGIQVPPGSIAFASATANPIGRGKAFRVGLIGLQAIAPGRGTIRWQFAPADPVNRNTRLTAAGHNSAAGRTWFVDYPINIVGASK
jgi:hypothetical protein